MCRCPVCTEGNWAEGGTPYRITHFHTHIHTWPLKSQQADVQRVEQKGHTEVWVHRFPDTFLVSAQTLLPKSVLGLAGASVADDLGSVHQQGRAEQ